MSHKIAQHGINPLESIDEQGRGAACMMDLEPGIRNGVRAVILRERQLLLLRKAYEDGSERYVLPGGAQDQGETLTEALQRECREEIGTEVMVSGLLYLADYFKPRTGQPDMIRQQLELLFLCEVPGDYVARNGHSPDKHQDAVVWIAQDSLMDINLMPSDLCSILSSADLASHPVYLGEIKP